MHLLVGHMRLLAGGADGVIPLLLGGESVLRARSHLGQGLQEPHQSLVADGKRTHQEFPRLLLAQLGRQALVCLLVRQALAIEKCELPEPLSALVCRSMHALHGQAPRQYLGYQGPVHAKLVDDGQQKLILASAPRQDTRLTLDPSRWVSAISFATANISISVIEGLAAPANRTTATVPSDVGRIVGIDIVSVGFGAPSVAIAVQFAAKVASQGSTPAFERFSGGAEEPIVHEVQLRSLPHIKRVDGVGRRLLLRDCELVARECRLVLHPVRTVPRLLVDQTLPLNLEQIIVYLLHGSCVQRHKQLWSPLRNVQNDVGLFSDIFGLLPQQRDAVLQLSQTGIVFRIDFQQHGRGRECRRLAPPSSLLLPL
mmetsp:Transcript_209/g.513  ORF Transcript_209/g.513 Transcript_209/m.513 type:complete len:370 (+) Transcript_209:1158-2267(+)